MAGPPGGAALLEPAAGLGAAGAEQPPTAPPAEAAEAAPPGARPLVEFRNITSAILAENFQSTDAVTCVALHPRIAVIGTRQGSIYQVDAQSNKVTKLATNGAHVHAISLDAEGRFLASGTADGRVTVMPIVPGTGESWVAEHGTAPVLSVAICPEYSSSASSSAAHVVCVGGEEGRLILHRRRGLMRPRLIHEGEGAVSRICWRTSLVAWANERGVKIFNALTDEKVTFIPRPALDGHCSLAWAADDRLILGWGTLVKVAVVLRKQVNGAIAGPPALAPGHDTVPYVEVRHHFSCPETVCGVASMGAGNVTVLTSDSSGTARLRFCGLGGEVFYTAEVPISRGVFPSHMHLSSVAPHLPMYLVAPRDVVVFQVRDMLEHAVQLLEHGQYDDAIRLADGGGEGIQGLRHIVCLRCVAPDLKQGNFEKACETVARFRELEAPTWQECIVLFDRFGALRHLAVNIPVPPRGSRLPEEVYDEALKRLVNCPSALVAVLSWWPKEIFTVKALMDILVESLGGEEALTSERVAALGQEDRCRAEALAVLAGGSGNLERAARLMLDLGNPEVFRLFREGLTGDRRLVAMAEASVQRLFEIDNDAACAVLVEGHAAVSVDAVVAGLQGCDNRWRHKYLKQLFAKSEVAGQLYHMQMVELFAEYEPEGLLQFLRASERYPPEDALLVCQQRGLLEEEAYLLGRAGRVSEALAVLLERVGDVDRAVEFASEYQDPKLWESLVIFVLDRPHLLVPLLDRLNTLDNLFGEVGRDSGRAQPPLNAKPAHVLRRVPGNTPVCRVAASVGRIFRSVELSRSLHESCSKLSLKESQVRKRGIIDAHQRGSLVAPAGRRCSCCGRRLRSPPPEEGACAPQVAEGPAPDAAGASFSSSASPAARAPAGAAAASSAVPLATPRRRLESEASSAAGGAGPGEQQVPHETAFGGVVLQGRLAFHLRCHELRRQRPVAASGSFGSAAAAAAPLLGSPRVPDGPT